MSACLPASLPELFTPPMHLAMQAMSASDDCVVCDCDKWQAKLKGSGPADRQCPSDDDEYPGYEPDSPTWSDAGGVSSPRIYGSFSPKSPASVASDVAEHALSNIDLSAACEQTASNENNNLIYYVYIHTHNTRIYTHNYTHNHTGIHILLILYMHTNC